MTRDGYPEKDDPCKCGHCGHEATLDEFGGVALPDGMIRCNRCHGVSETISGAAVSERDLELANMEFDSGD